jgi:type IV pilus assembly protein PilA
MVDQPQAAHAVQGQPGGAETRTSPWAIWALVLGVLGLCCFPVGIAGAVIGIVGLVRMEKDRALAGKGFAIAGLALGVSSVFVNGIIAAVAIPAFIGYTRRAKLTEATNNIDAIYARVEEQYSQQGSIDAVALTPGEIPCGEPRAWTAQELARFAGLGFAPSAPTNYSYEVVPSHQPDVVDGFVVIRARGDLDCDGKTSLFELAVSKDDGGALVRTRGLDIQDEIE